MKRKVFAVLLCCAMLAGVVSGCGGAASSAGETGDAGGSGQTVTIDPSSVPFPADASGELKLDADQTFNMTFSSPNDIDVNYGGSRALLTEAQEGLIRVFTNEKGDYIVPGGAESWDISEDGLHYVFHLRKNAKWSDGEPVTAQNYVDSWKRLLDPANGFGYAYLLFPVVGAEEYYNGQGSIDDFAVKATDDYTLDVTLKVATPQFIKQQIIIALYPIRKDKLDANPDTWATEHTQQVYNGPYMITDWVKGSTMKLEKNPHYWDAANVHINTVNLTVVAETSTKAQMFENRDIDYISATQDYIGKYHEMAEKGEITELRSPYAAAYWFSYNMKTGGPSGLMNNAKIRKAIGMALNREEFLEVVYGRYYPAYGIIPFGMQNGEVEYRSVVEEPMKAEYEANFKDKPEAVKALFAEGLKELGISKDPSEITLTYIGYQLAATDKAAQEYIQQTLEKNLGVKISLNAWSDSKIWSAARDKGEYDLMLTGWYCDYNDPLDIMDLFVTDGPYSNLFGSYSSPKFDALHQSLKGENDEQKRLEIYKEMERVLVMEDCGALPVYYMDAINYHHNYIKNIFTPLFGGGGMDYSRLYISGK